MVFFFLSLYFLEHLPGGYISFLLMIGDGGPMGRLELSMELVSAEERLLVSAA